MNQKKVGKDAARCIFLLLLQVIKRKYQLLNKK